MLKKLSTKLKTIKMLINNIDSTKEDFNNEIKSTQDNEIITVSNKNNIFKVEINDYIPFNQYVEKMKSNPKFSILNLINYNILWNNDKKKVNKGTYYIILLNNANYVIYINDDEIKIDERITKEDFIEEKILTFNTSNNDYIYFSLKHDELGSTFYTKYYSKNKEIKLGALDLSPQETFKEIDFLVYNLEKIKEIEKIIDIDLLELHVINDLYNNLIKEKTFYKQKN